MKFQQFLSPLRAYIGILSFVLISILASIYIFTRTSFGIISIFLSVVSVLIVIGFFCIFVPYSFSAYFSLFTSALFPAFSMSVWCVQRISSLGFISAIAILLVGIVPILAHFYTFKIDLTTAKVYEVLITVFSFYLFGAVLFASIPQLTPQTTVDFVFFAGIIIFIIVSVQASNMALRTKMLNEKLQMKNRIKEINEYERILSKKSEYDQTQISFILLYLKQSFNDFIAGNFERSFDNAFKILFDEYRRQYIFKDIYQVKNYTSRRRKFAPIRNSLAHAKARSGGIQKTEDLKELRKGLFENTLDILEIVKLDFMDIITS